MRTTGVRLVAETTQYKREMRESAKATRGVKDEIDDTATAGDKLGDSLSKAAKASTRDLDELRRHAAEVDKQINATQRGLTSLARGFASTGDTGLFKAIREQQRQLRQLKNVRNLLPDADDITKAGAGVGGQLIGGIRSAMSSASPAALGAGAIGLLLAPTVGAAVAGAVVGGAAGLGVVGGLVLAARDDRVKQAGQDLGQFVLGDLERRSGAFVPATLDGIARIRQGWLAIGPDLDRIFTSSRFVAPLLDGAIKGGKAFVSGFADGVEEAEPVVGALHNMLEGVGTAAGDAFRTLAGDAKEGASAVNDLTGSITSLIGATVGIVHASAQLKGYTDEIDVGIDRMRFWIEDHSALRNAMKDAGLQIDLTADGFHYGTIQAEAYRKATLGTATAVDFATLKQAGMSDAQIASADASGKYRGELEKVRVATQQSAAANGTLIATEENVKEIQKQATFAQQDYTRALEAMAPSGGRAAQVVDGLRKATTNLYGAQMQATDANEAYEASWDQLSESVGKNKSSLDIHTKAGRSNRDALQALLGSSREMYFADVNAGVAIDSARKKHETRTTRIREEARQLGLNKTETDKLITSYGRIPKKRETDVVLDGVKTVVNKLMDLYVYQRSLAEGVPVGSIRAILNKEKGPAKRYGGYHEGGFTGRGGKHEPAGIVHREEFVLRKEATAQLERANPGLLDEMNATGQMPGYATGGWVGAGPVETRARMPYEVDLNRLKIPTREQVAAKVVGVFNRDWPSSPSAQRGDSGVWRKVVALIRSTGPLSGSFGNAYRPGDPKWHGSGRAVDWMGFNQDALATFLARQRPLELIHRSNRRDYAYTRGVNKGSFNQGLMNAHRNHVHIAMAGGGMIREPVFGVGASGATYSFGENGVHERVIPMGSSGGSTNVTIVLENHGAIGSKQELQTWLAGGIDDLKRRGRI